jgi:hypothetical protein
MEMEIVLDLRTGGKTETRALLSNYADYKTASRISEVSTQLQLKSMMTYL